jgi:hypothetical protein
MVSSLGMGLEVSPLYAEPTGRHGEALGNFPHAPVADPRGLQPGPRAGGKEKSGCQASSGCYLNRAAKPIPPAIGGGTAAGP